MIYCKGTVPATGLRCGARLVETDGERFYFRGAAGEDFLLELDPPRVLCVRCGYRTRLRYRSRGNRVQ